MGRWSIDFNGTRKGAANSFADLPSRSARFFTEACWGNLPRAHASKFVCWKSGSANRSGAFLSPVCAASAAFALATEVATGPFALLTFVREI